MPEGSVTVVSVESPSINGLATPASTGVMSPIQCEESQASAAARDARAAAQSQRVGHLVEHLTVCENLRRSDLDFAGARLRNPRRLDEVAQHIADADCLGGCGEPPKVRASPAGVRPASAAFGSSPSRAHHHAGAKPSQRWSLIRAGSLRRADASVRCWDAGRSPRRPR